MCMITIKVLDPDRNRSTELAEIARNAATNIKVQAVITRVADFVQIRQYGIHATPGLVIDERVVCTGRVPSCVEITKWLTTALAMQRRHRPRSGTDS